MPSKNLEQSEYDREWAIELEAEKLFKVDHPTGSFPRRLPQFRSSCPDPIGDHYRKRARTRLDLRDLFMGEQQ